MTAGGCEVRTSIVDAGAVCALLEAEPLGLHGDESTDQLAERLELLIAFRQRASVAAGLSRTTAEAADAVPKVGVVAAPVDYRTTGGQPIAAGEYDLAARMVSMRQPHPAIGLTSAVALTVAASIPGTTAHEAARRDDPHRLRIGTPSGVVTAEIERAADGSVAAVVLWRAARRLASARLEIPQPEGATTPVTASAPASVPASVPALAPAIATTQ